jgi:hypothetical protein
VAGLKPKSRSKGVVSAKVAGTETLNDVVANEAGTTGHQNGFIVEG